MKKMISRFMVAIFVFTIALFGSLPQTVPFAPGAADEAFAETTYTVFIYSGKEGYFGNEDTTVKKITGLKYGEEVTVSLEDLDLELKNPDEYYPRGLKIAGHDNDELSSVQMQSYTFPIEEDMAFSVAYGMKGGMVKYTVNYRDGNGNKLRDSEEYYGMAGDRPVVAFKHVDGYLPDDYNLTKRLTDSPADNVFNFTYHRVYEESGEASDEDGDEGADDDGDGNGTTGGNGTAGRNGTTGGAGGTATAGGGNNIPGTNITNLDNNETPLAPGDDGEDKDKGGLSGSAMGFIGIVIAGILIALLLLYLVLRKRKDEEA